MALRPVQDARIVLGYISTAERSCEAAVDNVIESAQKIFAPRRTAHVRCLGRVQGHRPALRGPPRRERYRVWVFVAPVTDEAGLYVFEFSALADEDKVGPGFELIRASFRCLKE
ncbi:MAG: hypothetical protein MZU84_09335 [Sphingobacterium sp.]|nr:hypothetical protein [Sphingobacterium sp.]